MASVQRPEPAKLHPAPLQFPPEFAEFALTCPKGIKVQPNVQTSAGLGRERGNKARANLVGGKDIGFHRDRLGRLFNRPDHRIKKNVPLDEQLERTGGVAQPWHTDRRSRLCQRWCIFGRWVKDVHDRGLPPRPSGRNPRNRGQIP